MSMTRFFQIFRCFKSFNAKLIEILYQSKAEYPEGHESMVNANVDIFEMSYEESISYFKRLENLEKIRRTNGPNPSSLSLDNKNMYICYQ
jgi:hypothetical protein